jgi:hypothetical protein
MSDEAQKKLEAILREVHSNLPSGKEDPSSQSIDFVAEGETAYKEMERRATQQAVAPDDGKPAPPSLIQIVPGVSKPGRPSSIQIVPSVAQSTRTASPLSWDLQGTDTRFIVTNKSYLDGSDTKTFRIRNNSGSAKFVVPQVSDKIGHEKKTWSILSSSTCLRQMIKPGSDCTLLVQAKPDMDGQMNAFIGFYHGEPEKNANWLALSGYARGISGKLPDNVIGNGDRCPALGARAEVAISSTGGFNSNDGYFDLGYGQGKPKLATAECDHWEAGQNGDLVCNNPGTGVHTATQRFYQGETTSGPWQQTRVEQRYITASIVCREGLVDQVNWNW